MHNVFKYWSSKGLEIYMQMLMKNDVNSFEATSNRFHLAQSKCYKYLQPRNYINNFQKRDSQGQQPEQDL